MGSTAVGSDRRWFGGNGTFRHESRPDPHILEGVEAVSLLVSTKCPGSIRPARVSGSSTPGSTPATIRRFTPWSVSCHVQKVHLAKKKSASSKVTSPRRCSHTGHGTQSTHWNVKRRGASDAGHGMPGGSSLGRGTENKAPTGPQENTLTHNNPTLL